MLKKLRQKAKNKKGFTLVELIVVIVIILVLAAVLVPSLLKYVDRAKQANVRADAATVLAQLQADYAAGQATAQTGVDEVDGNYTVNGIPVTQGAAANNPNSAVYTVTDEEITQFIFNNGEYLATWNMSGDDAGWAVTEIQ